MIAADPTPSQHVRSNHPLLLEKLCPDLSAEICAKLTVPKVRVKLEKPKAVMWTSTTAVETIRHRSFFSNRAFSSSSSMRNTTQSSKDASVQQVQTVYLAFGSNVGDRASYVDRALQYLQKPSTLPPVHDDAASATTASPKDTFREVTRVVDVSRLYESEPMYVLEQERFLNGACKVRTYVSSPKTILKFF